MKRSNRWATRGRIAEQRLYDAVSIVGSYLRKLHYLTIRLQARYFYEVIVNEREARVNYRCIEIQSE